MKLRVLSFVMAAVCALTLLCTAAPVPAQAASGSDGDAVVQNIEVKWYYRIENGVREKRLWSVTERCWLTDWMPA